MRELRSFGSVRDEGREVLVYSETRSCSVVLGGAKCNGRHAESLIKSKLYSYGASHKPGARDFSALQARQFLIANPGLGIRVSPGAGPRRSGITDTPNSNTTVPRVKVIVPPSTTPCDGFTRSPLKWTLPPRTPIV